MRRDPSCETLYQDLNRLAEMGEVEKASDTHNKILKVDDKCWKQRSIHFHDYIIVKTTYKGLENLIALTKRYLASNQELDSTKLQTLRKKLNEGSILFQSVIREAQSNLLQSDDPNRAQYLENYNIWKGNIPRSKVNEIVTKLNAKIQEADRITPPSKPTPPEPAAGNPTDDGAPTGPANTEPALAPQDEEVESTEPVANNEDNDGSTGTEEEKSSFKLNPRRVYTKLGFGIGGVSAGNGKGFDHMSASGVIGGGLRYPVDQLGKLYLGAKVGLTHLNDLDPPPARVAGQPVSLASQLNVIELGIEASFQFNIIPEWLQAGPTLSVHAAIARTPESGFRFNNFNNFNGVVARRDLRKTGIGINVGVTARTWSERVGLSLVYMGIPSLARPYDDSPSEIEAVGIHGVRAMIFIDPLRFFTGKKFQDYQKRRAEFKVHQAKQNDATNNNTNVSEVNDASLVEGTGTISGRVIDSQGNPVKATIYFYEASTPTKPLGTSATGPSGGFVSDGLPAGNVLIKIVSDDGFVKSGIGARVKVGERETVTLKLPEHPTVNNTTTNTVENNENKLPETPNVKGSSRGITLQKPIRYDGTKVAKESYAILNELAIFLKSNPEFKLIQINVHTDNSGNPQARTEGRANSVKAYLVSQGVAAKRIIAKGHGNNKPIAPKGQAKNNRTTIAVSDYSQ